MLALAAAMLAAAAPSTPARCAYDRSAMLRLEQRAFDQDLQGGWRVIADRPGCSIAAADLIREYRKSHGSEDRILYWHEGQLRATAGQTSAALRLFGRSYKEGRDAIGWNAYVDATIAFLRRNRPGLLAARERLLLIPRSPDWSPRGPDGKPLAIAWPPNLNVVDGFIACFGQPYAKAYAPPCTKPFLVTRAEGTSPGSKMTSPVTSVTPVFASHE